METRTNNEFVQALRDLEQRLSAQSQRKLRLNEPDPEPLLVRDRHELSLGPLKLDFYRSRGYWSLETSLAERSIRAEEKRCQALNSGELPPSSWKGYSFAGPNEIGHEVGCRCRGCYELDWRLERELDQHFDPGGPPMIESHACAWCGQVDADGGHFHADWICGRRDCFDAHFAAQAAVSATCAGRLRAALPERLSFYVGYEDGGWSARSLDYDVTARGGKRGSAIEALLKLLKSHLVEADEAGRGLAPRPVSSTTRRSLTLNALVGPFERAWHGRGGELLFLERDELIALLLAPWPSL